MNRDMVVGAELLEKRYMERMRAMTAQQIEDDGGYLSILHREVMRINYEWNDETIAEFEAMSKRKSVVDTL